MGLALQKKQALVLGASQGIGRATAIALAAQGARVTALARSKDNLKDTLTMLRPSISGNHDYIAADLKFSEEVLKAVQEKAATHGAYDILVLNASGPEPGPIMEAKLEAFTEAFKVHILTSTLLVQTLVPMMQEKGFGRIINIISTSVKAPIPNLGVSNTIRGAVANWAKTLAGELAGSGITVNNVLPGFTNTSRLDSLIDSVAEDHAKTREEIVHLWQNQVPAGRFAEPEEIAAACAFLASPQASYCNGTNITVDGGRTPTL